MRFFHSPRAARMTTTMAAMAVLAGCGGSSGSTPPPSHDGGVALDAATVSDAAATTVDASDAAVSVVDAGDGSVGITIGLPGRPGQDLVTGGALGASTNFSLYSSMGESPGGNGVMSSANYKMVTGIVGTNSSQP